MTEQFDEGVKEVVLSLLALGASAYEVDYIKSLIDSKTEPIEQKIQAIKIADKQITDIKFDSAAAEVLRDLEQEAEPTEPVLVKPKIKYDLDSEEDAWNEMLDGVKHFEGFRSKKYVCSGGKETIGYGHTGSAVNKGDITEEEASSLLARELRETQGVVQSIVKVPLNSNQLAALTCFTYNCGRGALSQLVGKPGRLNDGNYDSVEEVLPKYRMAGGKIRKGLVRRRSFELDLWNNNL
jgi:lysozyme